MKNHSSTMILSKKTAYDSADTVFKTESWDEKVWEIHCHLRRARISVFLINHLHLSYSAMNKCVWKFVVSTTHIKFYRDLIENEIFVETHKYHFHNMLLKEQVMNKSNKNVWQLIVTVFMTDVTTKNLIIKTSLLKKSFRNINKTFICTEVFILLRLRWKDLQNWFLI